MTAEIWVAVLSLVGTLAGSFWGSRLTVYRVEQLEKKVDKHNNLVERMAVAENSLKSAHHRIDELAAVTGHKN